MEIIRTEGIILQSLPIKDWDLLITAFTHELGVIKFYYKNGKSRKRSKGAVTSPLTCAEFLFYNRNSDLIPLIDISVINVHVDLRKTLECLEYSCNWLQLIHKSQLPGKPSPKLYLLLKTYLKALQTHSNAPALHGSFYLKLLRHEGLIEINSLCSICRQPAIFQGSEAFCKTHSPAGCLSFTNKELETFNSLAFCRTLKELENIEIDKRFLEKILALFNSTFLLEG